MNTVNTHHDYLWQTNTWSIAMPKFLENEKLLQVQQIYKVVHIWKTAAGIKVMATQGKQKAKASAWWILIYGKKNKCGKMEKMLHGAYEGHQKTQKPQLLLQVMAEIKL